MCNADLFGQYAINNTLEMSNDLLEKHYSEKAQQALILLGSHQHYDHLPVPVRTHDLITEISCHQEHNILLTVKKRSELEKQASQAFHSVCSTSSFWPADSRDRWSWRSEN